MLIPRFGNLRSTTTWLSPKIGFDSPTGHFERDNLEHSYARYGDHWGWQIGAESCHVFVRDNARDSFDDNAPTTVPRFRFLISLKGYRGAVKVEGGPSRPETNDNTASDERKIHRDHVR